MEHIKGQEQSHSQTVHWRIFIFPAILALTGLLCKPQLDARIYQWVDGNGVIHYSNKLPADDRNGIKAFDEYPHNESEHIDRLETDQKELDEPIEIINKEKQQTSGEKQKKIEKAKQYQPDLFAYGCFSPSYSILMGRGTFEPIIPRDLSEVEYQELKKLFKGLDGFWVGNAQAIGCTESEGEVLEQMEHYSIKSKATMHRTGQFILLSDLYSRENGSSENQTLYFYLSEEQLASVPNIKVSDIELISVSSDELVYLEKRLRVGGRGMLRHEIVTAIKKTGERSFSLERFLYFNGRLISKSICHLERV